MTPQVFLSGKFRLLPLRNHDLRHIWHWLFWTFIFWKSKGKKCGHFKFWLMEHNPATYYGDWKDTLWTILIWTLFTCHECWDGYYYPQYGVAPHVHDLSGGSFIGSTKTIPKEQWPENYDDVDDGCGIHYCPNKKCRNSKERYK